MAISDIPRSKLGLVAHAQYVTITVLVELTRRTIGQPDGDIYTSWATALCDGMSGTVVPEIVQMKQTAETSRVDWRG